MAKLTTRQERFAHSFVELGNGTEAAKRAGYNPNSAFVSASKNMKNKDIVNRIKEIAKSFKSEQIADTKEVLSTLTQIMRGQSLDENIVTERKPVKHVIKDKNGKNVDKYFLEDISHIGKTKVTNSDRTRAAQLLGKHYAAFTERHDLSSDGNPIKIVNDIPKNSGSDKNGKS